MRSSPSVVALVAVIATTACGRVGFETGGEGTHGNDGGSRGDGGVDVPAGVPRVGLVGYWAFDEATGTSSRDLSGNGRDATLFDMEPEDWVPGVHGTALDFAADDYVRYGCAGTGCPTEAYSISLWFNADVLRGALLSYFAGEVYNSGRHETIAFTGSFLHCGRSPLRRGAPIAMFTTGRWYHLAVTYQGTTAITVYVDGADVTVETDDYWNSGAFSLGRRVDDFSALQYDGRIDEVAIYDRVLSPAEVESLYAAGQ